MPVHMAKCRYADKYKAIFAPRCNGGRACDACSAKWQTAQDKAKTRAAVKVGRQHEAIAAELRENQG